MQWSTQFRYVFTASLFFKRLFMVVCVTLLVFFNVNNIALYNMLNDLNALKMFVFPRKLNVLFSR